MTHSNNNDIETRNTFCFKNMPYLGQKSAQSMWQ